jgi:transketolase
MRHGLSWIGCRLGEASQRSPRSPSADGDPEGERLYDYRRYRPIYAKPGLGGQPRRPGSERLVNVRLQVYGLFLAASADLADSTNISGFAKGHGDFKGYGWYERYGSADGVLLPQEITEFANAGILVGMATGQLRPGS